MQRHFIVKIIIAAVLLFLPACTFQVKVEPTPGTIFPTQAEPLSTVTLPAQTVQPAQPTQSIPTPPADHTAIAANAVNSVNSASAANIGGRLAMDPGATDVSVDGQVEPDGRATYLVAARAGQFMIVSFNSVPQSLSLEIQSPDGTLLASAADQITAWRGGLPLDGDYRIAVVAGGAAESFNLEVIIPARITFAPGAVSAAVDGQIGAGRVNTYLLRALQDQTMTVAVSAPLNDVFLGIAGLNDGQPLVTVQQSLPLATVKLPATQDYVISLISTGSQRENYTVQFTVK